MGQIAPEGDRKIRLIRRIADRLDLEHDADRLEGELDSTCIFQVIGAPRLGPNLGGSVLGSVNEKNE